MENILTMIHYRGHWEDGNKFVDYEVGGIQIPKDSNYSTLLEILYNHLKLQPNNSAIVINFQVERGYVPMKIVDDVSFMFFKELKMNERNITAYLLCVEIMENERRLALYFGNEEGNSLTNQSDITLSNNMQLLEVSTTYHPEFDPFMINYVVQLSRNAVEELMQWDDNIMLKNQTKEGGIITNKMHQDIEVGQIYQDKETLKSVLSFHAIKNYYQFKVYRSCPKMYLVKCINANCSWHMDASIIKSTSNFKIRKFCSKHICPLDPSLSTHKQATSKIIGDFVKNKYDDIKTVYTPSDIIRDMRKVLGVSINYVKAWRSKEYALKIMRGNPAESYNLLPSYLYMLKKTNPGSVVHLLTQEDRSFLYTYIALTASIEGWINCRPIVVVDATFLNSTYRGTLLTTCTYNAAGKIFPLAFAVVDSENNASWEWFFNKFKESFGVRVEMCIVSDRNGSIEIAAQKVFPEVVHCVCIYHLLNNLKGIFKRNPRGITELFMAAAKAYTLEDFNFYLRELEKANTGISAYLQQVGYHRWSRVHSTVNRSSTMTSNIVESLNAANKYVKELPVSALLENLWGLIQDLSYVNRKYAQNTFTLLTEKYEGILRESNNESLRMKVQPTNDEIFKVMNNNQVYIVKLKEKFCSCYKFQMDELPCSHALAVINSRSLNPYEYYSHYYTKETMLATYESTVYPIEDQATWNIPHEIKEELVLPPKGRKMAGRPKKQRYKAVWEKKMSRQFKRKCSKCGGENHNRRSCKYLPQVV